MPNGVWVPFDYKTRELHKCSKEHNQVERVEHKAVEQERKSSRRLTKTDRILSAIVEGKDITYEYTSLSSGKMKRHLTPITVEIGAVSGFCHLRKEMRSFRIDSLHYLVVIDRVPEEINLGDIQLKKYKEVSNQSIAQANEYENDTNQWRAGTLWLVLLLAVLLLWLLSKM